MRLWSEAKKRVKTPPKKNGIRLKVIRENQTLLKKKKSKIPKEEKYKDKIFLIESVSQKTFLMVNLFTGIGKNTLNKK